MSSLESLKYTEIGVRASVVPHAAEWPEPDAAPHWEALHAAVTAARDAVLTAEAEMAKARADRELSDEGRRRRCGEIARRYGAKLGADKSLGVARSRVARVVEKMDRRIAATVRRPADELETHQFAEIRAHVKGLATADRRAFLSAHLGDAMVTGAVVGAPPFLSGLSEAEHAHLAEQVTAASDAEAAETRAAAARALEQLEHGWRVAIRRIGERAAPTRATA